MIEIIAIPEASWWQSNTKRDGAEEGVAGSGVCAVNPTYNVVDGESCFGRVGGGGVGGVAIPTGPRLARSLQEKAVRIPVGVWRPHVLLHRRVGGAERTHRELGRSGRDGRKSWGMRGQGERSRGLCLHKFYEGKRGRVWLASAYYVFAV